ncbi:hypothetical protein [Carnobacterium maltaromaticum]|uniref:hypothetical protein n=1 Tax=Carnobacterium maltaromaticum TaxID=2751 RepID=UPI00295F0C29|nr:hypothetical protein [Carnobacterium maltaromaticum]
MGKAIEVIEHCNLYNIVFLVELEVKKSIEKNIVFPDSYSYEEIEKIIFQRFNRVKKIMRIRKIDECTKLGSKSILEGEWQ